MYNTLNGSLIENNFEYNYYTYFIAVPTSTSGLTEYEAISYTFDIYKYKTCDLEMRITQYYPKDYFEIK
jgi:hypothetical protein